MICGNGINLWSEMKRIDGMRTNQIKWSVASSRSLNSIHSTFLLFRMGRKVKNELELKSWLPQAAYEEWVLIGLFFSLWVKGGSCRTAPQRKREQQHQSTWNSSIKRGRALSAIQSSFFSSFLQLLKKWKRKEKNELAKLGWLAWLFFLVGYGWAEPKATSRKERRAANQSE